MTPRPRGALLLLLAGLAAVSTAAAFVRLAQGEGMPSLVIAAGRLAFAAAVFAPVAAMRHRRELARLDVRGWTLLAVSGLVLAVHFAAWITALEHTTVVATVVLGSTGPIFVALLSRPFLREPVSRSVAAGVVLALAGGVLVALGAVPEDTPGGAAPLLGNALALLAALAFALYLLIGRSLRRTLSVVPYVTVVYGVAAAAAGIAVVLRGDRMTGHGAAGWGWVVAVGLVPQLIGHSAFNHALGALPAAYVGLVSRLEPVGSAILAGLVLGEWPDVLAAAGAAIIVVGVALPTASELRRQPAR